MPHKQATGCQARLMDEYIVEWEMAIALWMLEAALGVDYESAC